MGRKPTGRKRGQRGPDRAPRKPGSGRRAVVRPSTRGAAALADWLAGDGRSRAGLAGQLGCSAYRVHRLLHGQAPATLREAVVIEEITDGAVGAHAWLEVATPERRTTPS